jgi:membrane-bound lytic murein transglycosylase MltF
MKSKKLLYTYILLFFFAIFLMVLLFNINRQKEKPLKIRDLPQIAASGILNIVTDYNSIGYFVSGYSIAGFQYEMIRALEREWGIPVAIFIENGLNDNLNGLYSCRYDLIARTVPITTTLRDSFAFTQPIILNKQVLIQRTAIFNENINPIRQHLELAQKTIRVPENSPIILRLNNLAHEIGDTIYIEECDHYETEQLVMLVASGEIDFTVSDERTARQLAAKLPEIDIETDISFTQMESWVVRKNSPLLLDSLAAWLTRFRETDEFKRIYNRYY